MVESYQARIMDRKEEQEVFGVLNRSFLVLGHGLAPGWLRREVNIC